MGGIGSGRGFQGGKITTSKMLALDIGKLHRKDLLVPGRTAIVYGDSKFLCRHCHKLVYACQRENDNYRSIRQADAIRKRLGWQNGIANLEGGKPKGMHWRTFHKLKTRYDTHANEAWVLIELRLIQMEQRLLRKGIR